MNKRSGIRTKFLNFECNHSGFLRYDARKIETGVGGPSSVPNLILTSHLIRTSTAICMGCVALLLGASGETGKEILNLLASSQVYSKVIIIVRREMDLKNVEGSEKVEQGVVDFDNLDRHIELFSGVDIAFCVLGYRANITYLFKLARFSSPDDIMKKVDHDYVVAAAKLLKEGGCPCFLLLTAYGAHPESSLLLQQTKGRAEKSVLDLGFKRLTIFRPMQLVNGRDDTVFGMNFIMWIAKNTDSSFRWSVTNKIVAQAMLADANNPGDETENSDETGEKNPIAKIINHLDIVKIAQKIEPAVPTK